MNIDFDVNPMQNYSNKSMFISILYFDKNKYVNISKILILIMIILFTPKTYIKKVPNINDFYFTEISL